MVVSLILWNTRKHIWNGHQKRAIWQHTRGSRHLNKLNIVVYDKKGVKKVFRTPNPSLFDMCQIVTWTSQNPKTLSSYIFKSCNSLHDHVQFIITMFMLRQCIWGLRRSKMCHWEKPVPTRLVFMLLGPNTSLKLSQAMQKQRVYTFH